MIDPLQILILSDGKPGHENQSRGLAEAIKRLTPANITVLPVPRRNLLLSLFLPRSLPPETPRPALLVGAGHRVHGRLLGLSRRTGAPNVVLMKPTLPAALFDLCLIPEHDYEGRDPEHGVILTRGALNLVPPPGNQARRGGLILVGGPSRSHGWDDASIADAVRTIVGSCADRPWRITDSRRTPDGTLARIGDACPAVAAFPHESTGRDWLPLRLAEAAEVWVTEDSVSMIYEALSSGARVGLLPTPRLGGSGRVARGIDRLVGKEYLTRFEDWQPGTPLPAPPEVLRESSRCARIVLARFFPERSPA